MKKTVIITFLILNILLSACQSLFAQESLEDSTWSLIELNGDSLLPGSHIELQFNQDTISGFGGCNSYGGRYQISGDRFSVSDGIESTAMACLTPAGIGDQESQYFLALQAADHFQVTDDRLELSDASGEFVLVFIYQQEESTMDLGTLTGSNWQVLTVEGETLIPGSQITMAFSEEGVVEGFGGCRSYQADYLETDQGVSFTTIRMGEETCNQEELLVQEQDFTDFFTWSKHFEQVGDTLVLITQRGEQIVFVPYEE
jgi:putative lipoprotein